MKSNKVIHHTGRDANVFSDVETEIENLRTAVAALVAPSPSGRLTLTSGDPWNTEEVIGGQTLYYAPLNGKKVPILSSGTLSQVDFTSSATDQVGLSLALGGSGNWAAGSVHDVFAILDGGAVKLATRVWDADMYETESQITNATAITTGTGATAWTRSSAAFDGTTAQAVAAAARNTPSNNSIANYLGQDWGSGVTKTVSKVVITTPTDDALRGDAPSELVSRIEGSNDGSTWNLLHVTAFACNTGNAAVHTIVVNEANQVPYRYHRVGITGNGASAINVAEVQFYNKVAAAGGRRLTRSSGVLVNDASMTARISSSSTVTVAQYEGTYLGTIYIDAGADGQVTCHTKFGASRVYGLWNAYNQRSITVRAGIIASVASLTYNLSSPIWGAVQSSSTYSMTIASGLAAASVQARFPRVVYLNATLAVCNYEAGIGIDTTLGFSGTEFSVTQDSTGNAIGFNGVASHSLKPFAGTRTLYGVERANVGGATGTVSLFTDIRNSVLEATWLG